MAHVEPGDAHDELREQTRPNPRRPTGRLATFAALLADSVRRKFPQWEQEAGEVDYREQNPEAGDYRLWRCIQDEIIAHFDIIDPPSEECDRLRAGLEMIAQVRHVSGSAQGAFRHNLAIADAVLAGADVRNLETVQAIADGRWK